MPVKTPIATYRRDGETRDVYTRGEATSLHNDGWSLVVPTPDPVVSPPAVAAADEPKPKPIKRSHKKKVAQ